nr:putative nuclease HARBI1 [Dermacentor andersoni]XP_054921071.1 putative nuclease HARBI1 [Dermacentor andersoni]XP_054921072.1 putative nuclease HARBI1 [Dermacentor andersoni]
MAASRTDVARRLAAFEFACHAMDTAFSEAHSLPRIPRPALRDRGNPMELYDDQQFLGRYRFTKNAVRQLLAMVPIRESGDNRGQPVPPMLQLLMALRFYGAGTFQTVTGDLARIPQSTVCRAVGKMTLLIAKHLRPMLVRFPQSARLPKVMREFYEVAEYPGVTGCVDCTHVRIKSPGGDDAEVFRNRKGFFSIIVQVSNEN